MSLNLSRGSVISSRAPERSLISPIGFSNGNAGKMKSLHGFDWSRSSESLGLDLENAHYYNAKGNTEMENPCEQPLNDVLARLPDDPFGMDKGSTFMAISGCFQSFEKGFQPGDHVSSSRIDEDGERIGYDDSLLAGLNWVFHTELGDGECEEEEIPYDLFNGFEVGSELFCDGFLLDGSQLGYWMVNNGAEGGQEDCSILDSYVEEAAQNWAVNRGTKGGQEGCSNLDSHGEVVAPNDAIFFVLGYLGVQDLLSMEKVCTSLRYAVRNDSLLWQNILITRPLNEKITDDALIKLTSRSKGTLQCLSLLDCVRITNGGLKHVLDNNPRLIKLSVPGCVRVSVEGILPNLKAIKSAGTSGIKYLRIGELSGVTDALFKELRSLMGADKKVQLIAKKPRFYRGRQSYLLCDDDRPIDIEACPRCQKPRLVYDCPAEHCHASQLCRACTLCISRCVNCGHCIGDCDYVETFCLDMLCFDCWERLLDCQERLGEKFVSSKCTIFIKRTQPPNLPL